MGKDSTIGTNPEICPECLVPLTTRNWRKHLKDWHGYSYLGQGPYRDYLFPPNYKGVRRLKGE